MFCKSYSTWSTGPIASVSKKFRCTYGAALQRNQKNVIRCGQNWLLKEEHTNFPSLSRVSEINSTALSWCPAYETERSSWTQMWPEDQMPVWARWFFKEYMNTDCPAPLLESMPQVRIDHTCVRLLQTFSYSSYLWRSVVDI